VSALAELRERAETILAEVEKAIVGKRGPLELILLALLSDGHVLLEDYPGLAKTLIARSFAQATCTRFARIQFTPDLMPGDVTGSQIFDQRTTEFVFRPGPIFANLLLADEINRAPPKTQAALLGDDVWELLRPDRPEPKDRHGPGVPHARVAAVIERVESL
jgi:MoxR-like ATPase